MRRGRKRLGYAPDQAVGKTFFDYDQKDDGKVVKTPLTIVGVTTNFKIQGDRTDVVPTYYVNHPGDENMISVRAPANDLPYALSAIDHAWHQFAPSVAIDRHFLNEDFEKQFASEERQKTIFTLFVGIAIFIAAMGLFGLAAFSTERRTKEIGIRKIFGAKHPRHCVAAALAVLDSGADRQSDRLAGGLLLPAWLAAGLTPTASV